MAGEGNYPVRKQFFAQKFQRTMAKVCLAQEFGPAAYVFLSIIVGQEDACRYQRPVRFYDAQLMPLIGVNSRDTIIRLRRKLILAGWLNYVRGHKGVASLYWVGIPERYSSITDCPIEEGFSGSSSRSVQNSDTKPTETRQKADRIRSDTNLSLNPVEQNEEANLQEQAKPRVLSERFVFYWTERKSGARTPRSAVEIEPQFAEHLRRNPGHFDSILKEIEHKSRNRNEWPDKLLGRFEPKNGYHQPALPSTALPDANDFYAQKQAEYQAALKSEQGGQHE